MKLSKRMDFPKVAKGGGAGSFSIKKKIILQITGLKMLTQLHVRLHGMLYILIFTV